MSPPPKKKTEKKAKPVPAQKAVPPPVKPAPTPTPVDPADVIDTAILLDNPRHERFCREYLIDRNGTRAYMRVYPNSSYDAARNSAAELLANPCIRARIDEVEKEILRRLEVTPERITAELAKLAFFNAKDLYDNDGNLKDIHSLDPDVTAAITSIKVASRVTGDEKDCLEITREVKLADKKGCLELLGKKLKMFTTIAEVTGKDGAPLLGEATVLTTPEQRDKVIGRFRKLCGK